MQSHQRRPLRIHRDDVDAANGDANEAFEPTDAQHGEELQESDSADFDDESPDLVDDDARWDVFLADDDERDPLPAVGDFWTDGFKDDD